MADSGLIHILNMAVADIQVRSVVHLHHLICVCQVFNSHAYASRNGPGRRRVSRISRCRLKPHGMQCFPAPQLSKISAA